MDRATVIVALPPVDDRVNKVSSEKAAHLTMLYLGDVDLSSEAVLYVQHACAELSPFGLSVEYRGTLGDDEADVLFFEKNAWDLGRVAEFRHHLLLNDEIKRAYDSADQFPEWTPHLTLGYPEVPAIDDPEDRRFHYVDFDRIAVWTGDFEGPEFRLKYDNHAMEVSMSDMTAAQRGEQAVAELFHYGKKGMKWGVRNDKGHEGEKVKTKDLDKLDKKWEKENTGQAAYMRAYNDAAKKMNDGGIDAINNKPEYLKAADDGILNDMDHPTTKAYFAEHETAFHNAMVESWAAVGASPSGRKSFQIKEVDDGEGGTYKDVFLAPVDKTVKHAAGDTEVWFRLKRDDKGLVTEYLPEERELKHYGKKGMKWGVTNSDKPRSRHLNPMPEVENKKYSTEEIHAARERVAAAAKKYQEIEARDRASGRTDMSPELNKARMDWWATGDLYVAARKTTGEKFVRAWLTSGVSLAFDRDSRTVDRMLKKADPIQHSDAEDEFAHYGVKGMKWGVTTKDGATSVTQTREKTARRDTKDVTVTQKKAGTYVKTTGGQRNKAHEDAIKAQARRQVAKKSTTDALSNKELKDTIERMRLEQEYKKLDSKVSRRGSNFVSWLLSQPEMNASAQNKTKK